MLNQLRGCCFRMAVLPILTEEKNRRIEKIHRELGSQISGLLQDATVVEILLNPDRSEERRVGKEC